MIHPNGSEATLSPGPFSQTTSIKKCPCEDGKKRFVRISGIPTTAWTIPAKIVVDGMTVSGSAIYTEGEGYVFRADPLGKNYPYFQQIINAAKKEKTD